MAAQDDVVEETYHEFHPSWSAWFWPLVLTLGLWFPIAWMQRQSTTYTVTSDRVVVDRGLLKSTTTEVRTDSISRIHTERSLGESLFGCGTIVVDTGPDEIRMTAVPNCSSVVESIRGTL